MPYRSIKLLWLGVTSLIQNVVIGEPLVPASEVIAFDSADQESTEKQQTLFTNTRFLPAIMKEAGMVSSISEVRRNQPKLMVNLTEPDCLWLKWGKRFLFIVVGEE